MTQSTLSLIKSTGPVADAQVDLDVGIALIEARGALE